MGFLNRTSELTTFKVLNIRKDQLSSITQNASQAHISNCATA